MAVETGPSKFTRRQLLFTGAASLLVTACGRVQAAPDQSKAAPLTSTPAPVPPTEAATATATIPATATAAPKPTEAPKPTAAPTVAEAKPIEAAKPTEAPKPTATPTPIKAATPTEIPIATLIPTEAPKRTYWPWEKVVTEQEKAAKNKQPLLLDTWSDQGARIEEATSFNDHNLLVLNGFKKGDVFLSPVGGQVSSVFATVGNGFKIRGISIINNGMEVNLALNYSDNILVKQRDIITVTTPLAQLSGDQLPARIGISTKGQISIGVIIEGGKKVINISTKNILADENGVPVSLPSQAGK